MSWGDHLAAEARKREKRRHQARQTTEARRKTQAGHVKVFLPQLAGALRGAADTYNQSVSTKIDVDSPRKRGAGDAFEVSLLKRGFRFEDSGKGFIRVYHFGDDFTDEYAFVQPVTNKAGDLTGWQEKQVFPGGKTMGRNLDSLTEAYLLATVRLRLLPSA
jgi:hypothetical protein